MNASAVCKRGLSDCNLNFTKLKEVERNCRSEKLDLNRTLKGCQEERDRVQFSEGECVRGLGNVTESLTRCETRVVSLEGQHKKRLDDMSEDFCMVGEASHCLKQCGGLTAISEKYMCVL